MKKNKGMNLVNGIGEEEAGKKIPYEKPIMTAISLFADQVLNTCVKSWPTASCLAYADRS